MEAGGDAADGIMQEAGFDMGDAGPAIDPATGMAPQPGEAPMGEPGPGGWSGDTGAGPAGEGMPPLGDMPPMGDPNAPPPGGPMGEPGGPGPMDGGPAPMDGGPDLGAINQAMDMETTDPTSAPDAGPGPMDEPAPDMPPPEDEGGEVI